MKGKQFVSYTCACLAASNKHKLVTADLCCHKLSCLHDRFSGSLKLTRNTKMSDEDKEIDVESDEVSMMFVKS